MQLVHACGNMWRLFSIHPRAIGPCYKPQNATTTRLSHQEACLIGHAEARSLLSQHNCWGRMHNHGVRGAESIRSS